MQNNKKHSQPLTVFHLDVPRLLICQGQTIWRTSAFTERVEKLPAHQSSSVTSCMGCRATNQAKCIQTLETLDFDNNRIASRLMKIHPSCRVLILSQDPHHSVLICRFCQLFANLPYQGTPRNLHCSAAVNPGDGFAPIGGMPAAAGRNTFYISTV